MATANVAVTLVTCSSSRATYLETVFHEGFGIEKPMEKYLSCCHGHLSEEIDGVTCW